MDEILPESEQNVPAYITESKRESSVVVLVFPSILGIDEDIELLCEDISYVGAHAVAIDPFWQVDPGPLSRSPDDIRRGLARKNRLSRQQSLKNIKQFCTDARKMGNTLIALGVGYGGELAFHAAAENMLDGAVIWMASSLPRIVGLVEQIEGPMSIHFGKQDVVVGEDDILLIEQAFQQHEQVHVHVHEDAKHGYCYRSHVHFHPDAYENSFSALEQMIHTVQERV